MGACASCGGVFDTYTMIQGVDNFIPVDIYVPGCPPRPENMIIALQMMQDRIDKGTIQKEIDARTGIPMTGRQEQLLQVRAGK